MFWQLLGPEDLVEASTSEIGQVNESSVRRRRLEQSDTISFLFVVLELVEIKEITSIVAAAKDYVAASWIVTEGTEHFWRGSAQTKVTARRMKRTLYFVVGSFFALTNINDAEQGLVDTEALCKGSKILLMA
jgi:hypothetical protein